MTQHSIHHEATAPPDVVCSAENAHGIVEHVDAVLRELLVLTEGGLKVIDVPVDCPIFLHGERIKLRMIQPRDHVKLRLRKFELESGDETLTASSVEVQPDNGFSCFRL
jgi:hypothetical protein